LGAVIGYGFAAALKLLDICLLNGLALKKDRAKEKEGNQQKGDNGNEVRE
jgi:hypothetical protein